MTAPVADNSPPQAQATTSAAWLAEHEGDPSFRHSNGSSATSELERGAAEATAARLALEEAEEAARKAAREAEEAARVKAEEDAKAAGLPVPKRGRKAPMFAPRPPPSAGGGPSGASA